ncbi:type IV secretory system conjugative DNA transfer family protein [Jatrophihabitans sp. DSM 45814]
MSIAEEQLLFSDLDLPRPLTVEQIELLLLRLSADRAAPLIVLEARATSSGIRHMLGIRADNVRWAQRTLRDFLPGLAISGLQGRQHRIRVQCARRLRLRPHSFALATDRAESSNLALLSALNAHMYEGETLVLQVMLGPRLSPKHLRGDIADPLQPWWQRISRGQLVAPKPVRDQILERRGKHGFAATIRIGVAARSPQRRHQLTVGILGAISTAQSRNVHIDMVGERPSRVDAASAPWRWPLHLAINELSGLLGWPIGERDMPGLPPLHPRRLPVPASVSTSDRVFARSIAHGQARPVGISAADSLGHLVALGPTGSGKSTALLHLIRADIEAGRAVLVIDPKRQLIDDIVDRAIPENRISDVVIIDPAELTPAGFNPLDVGARDPDVVVDGLLAVLAAVFHDGWGPRTQDIVHSGLLTLARVGHERAIRSNTSGDGLLPFTLLDLPRLLTESAFRTPIIGEVAGDPGLGQFWAWYQGMTPTAQAQAISAPLNKLRQYLLRPSLRRILGQPQPVFRLRDIFQRRRIVLVPLNEGLIGPLTAQLLGSLIVAEAWSATLERANERNPAGDPASIFVDEVQQYLHLPSSIGNALAQSRSLGVGWHIAHQYRAQLPIEMRAAVDSNAKSKLVFRPNDPDDARDMARQSPELDPVDFQSLGAHAAYANLTTRGTPSGWCSIQTLPPPAVTGLGDQVRAATRQLGQPPPPPQPTAESETTAEGRIGRKRRSL